MKVCWLVSEIKVRLSRYSHESADCQHGSVIGCVMLGVEFKRSKLHSAHQFGTLGWPTALQDLSVDRQLKWLTTRGVSPAAYCICKWRASDPPVLEGPISWIFKKDERAHNSDL